MSEIAKRFLEKRMGGKQALALRSQIFLGRLLVCHPSHFVTPDNVNEARFDEPIPLIQPQEPVKEPVKEPEQQKIELPVIPSVREIATAVAGYYKIKLIDFMSLRRTANVTHARQVTSYLARTLTTCSLPQIGRVIGRDHTTVMHGIRVITEEIERDDTLRVDIRRLTAILTKPSEREAA